ncbi:hypothetical protein B566_EDAN012603 [Ephemera danica]|nr:hypothetical protein B566_EDAN012603 [Ephemera danica]
MYFAGSADSPVLWVRLDPEMTLVRAVKVQQPDYMWQYQLRHERDITAQAESIVALEQHATPATRLALTDTIENEQVFIKVRLAAAHCLTKVANAMVSGWAGPPAMLAIFRKLFGSFSCPHVVRQNDFQNLQLYFLQKTIPVAMAGLRNAHGICPPEVIKFLLDLFRYNDNSKNRFSDNYYRAALVEALGTTVTPTVSMLTSTSGVGVTSESLSGDTKLVLEEVTRSLNLDKLLPCYKLTVTVTCLGAIRRLQKCGHIPSSPSIFRAYAAYGQFQDVRIAGLKALVDFQRADGTAADLDFLLNLTENDPEPRVRHELLRLLISTPPFDMASSHPLDTEELATRIWNNMNQVMFFDSQLRCDFVDLYYALYGMRRPMCFSSGIVNIPKPALKREDAGGVLTTQSKVTGDYFSEQSQSLPGVTGATQGPTGFLPGMFHSQEETASTSTSTTDKPPKSADDKSGSKSKKKKKDKKKHRHKHKHKHEHKHRSGSEHKSSSHEKPSPLPMPQPTKEETLSSVSSSPSQSPAHDVSF